MSTVDLPSIREPFIDQRTGLITRAWWIWLQQLMTRIGGSGGSDLSAIRQAIIELIAESNAQQTELNGFVPLPGEQETLDDDGMVYVPPQDLSLTAPVQSVFGRTGVVTAQGGDYTVAQVTNAASVLATLAQFAATTSAQLAAVLSDETGTGSAVFGTSPTLTTPNIVGTATNNNAAAGSVGEYVTANANTALTTGTLTNVASISLTAGDWDVSGGFLFVASGGAVMTNQASGSNSVSATFGANGTFYQFLNAGTSADATMGGAIPTRRYSLAATTTIYGVCYAQFASGTVTVTSKLDARRVR